MRERGCLLWTVASGTPSTSAFQSSSSIEDGVIDNYQILTPSTWMASLTDPFDNPGPYEEAAMNTPLLEDYEDASDFSGIDVLRSVRSFDPCMPCTVHMHTDRQRDVIAEDVTSCGCSSPRATNPPRRRSRRSSPGIDLASCFDHD